MLRKQLLQAKEDMVKEYHNSNALLYELGGSFTDGFDDCLRKSKPPSWIWTCPRFPLMPKLRPQPVLPTLKVLTSYSWTTLLLILKVEQKPLFKSTRSSLLRT